jgi:hypothetical protein
LTGRTAHDGRTKQGERPGFFYVPWFSWRTKRFFSFFDVPWFSNHHDLKQSYSKD